MRSHPNLRDDHNNTLRSMHEDDSDRKGIIKRTKSFWRFRRSNSEEILEGMAMWKHRDLIDVVEKENVPNGKIEKPKSPTPPKPQERTNFSRSGGSERSNDSDRTMLARQYEENGEEIYGTNTIEPPKRRTPSFKAQQQKLSLPRRSQQSGNDIDIDDNFEKPTRTTRAIDDEFYDDDGDGLMRTVNRKSILQQYADSNIDSDSESDAITSDDPYDCIVVDDHTTTKQQRKQMRNSQAEVRKEKYPNVAEIGKKLEKLSKSSKYSPEGKEKHEAIRRDEYRNSMNNKMNKLTAYNNDKNLEISMKSESDHQEEEIKLRRYNSSNNRNSQPVRSPSPAQRHSFKTFGRDENTRSENGQSEPEMFIKPRHFEKKYHEKEHSEQEKRSSEIERRDKMNYYQDRRDEYGEENEKRQFLPRTKLVKTNSTMQTVMKFEQEIIDYDDTLRNKMKKPDYEDITPNNGNVYGPWYDLWGLDATVKK